jgi:hypothetical protein
MLVGDGKPVDDAEMEILNSVRSLLPTAGITLIPGRHSLAAELCRMWAGFYDDTWVWGGMF